MNRARNRKAPSRDDLDRLGTTPREVQLTAAGSVVALLAGLFAAGALAAALALPTLRVGQQTARDRLEREGIPADATIVRVTIEQGEDRRRVVTYRYSAPDGEHEHTVRLSMRDRRETVEDGRLAIVYLPTEPSRSWLAGEGPGVMPLWLLPAIPIVLVLIAIALALRVQRDRELLREGRFAMARVVSSKKVQGSHSHGYRVGYEFTTLSGATITASAKRDRPLPADMETIAVVYHREDPRRNAIYPLSLATPERW